MNKQYDKLVEIMSPLLDEGSPERLAEDELIQRIQKRAEVEGDVQVSALLYTAAELMRETLQGKR